MGKFCGKCGAELDQKTGLCPHCDAEKIKAQARKKTKRKRVKCVLAALLAGIVLLCALVGLSYFNIVHIPDISNWISRDSVYQIRNVMHYPDGDTVFISDTENMQFDENEAVFYYNNVLSAYTFGTLDQAEAKALAESVNGKIVGQLRGSVNLVQIQVEESTLQELKDMIAQLQQNENVIYATYECPMEIAEQQAKDQNPWNVDPKKPEKDRHNEDTPAGNDWWAEVIGAYSAWEYEAQCNPIKVGILDNGFDLNHEDLKGKLSLLSGYSQCQPADHGTHVAGVIAAKDNDIGIKGIANRADVVCADLHNFDSMAEYRKVLKQMIDEQVKVINNSWGVEHILSEEQYINSVYWDGQGYFHGISDTEIFLKKNQMGADWDRRISFVNDTQNDVAFFINQKKVSADTFKKKVKSDYLIRFCYDKDQPDKIAEVYWIKDDYSGSRDGSFAPSFPYGYNREKLTNWAIGGYDNYMAYVNTRAKNTGMDAIALIISVLTSNEDDFLLVQAAGNGYDDRGPGFDAKMNGYFCAIDEELFQSLNQGTREKLQKLGITYQTIKEHIMIVGAVRNAKNNLQQYEMTEFSDFGNTIDICAPGENVFSTITMRDGDANNKDEDDGKIYAKLSGTSMAAPMVTGSAAYIWSLNPDLTAAEVKEILCSHISARAYGVGEDTGSIYPMLHVGAGAAEAVSRASGEEIPDRKENNKEPDVPYVTDAYCTQYDCKQEGCPFVYHIPQINLESNEIKDLNRNIYEYLECQITESKDCLSNYYKSNYPSYINPNWGIDYRWTVNGDIVSLIIYDRSNMVTDTISYWIYNISIQNQTVLDTNQLLSAYGISQETYKEWIRNEIVNVDMYMVEFMEEESAPYIDESGALHAVITVSPRESAPYQYDTFLSSSIPEQPTRKPVHRSERIWKKYDNAWVTTGVDVPNEVVRIQFELQQENEMQSYAQITGFDEQNRVIWSYTTPKFENTDLPRISDIGPNQSGYYFVQDRAVVALDAQTGEKLWENRDFGGSGTGYDFDDNAIYLCGQLGPDFYAISYNGETLAKVEQCNELYYWPCSIVVDGKQAIIAMTGGPDGYDDGCNPTCYYVDLTNILNGKFSAQTDVSDQPFFVPKLGEEQIQRACEDLNVPIDVEKDFKIGNTYYWLAGDCWVTWLSIETKDGYADATVNTRTGELMRTIGMYTKKE